jgi:hypothetical protein
VDSARKLVLLVMLLSMAVTAVAGTYYIKTTATGSGTGTSGSPWTWQQGMDNATAGDSMVVSGGSYQIAEMGPTNAGSAGNWIVWAAAPGETPIVKPLSGAYYSLSIGQAYHRFRGISFTLNSASDVPSNGTAYYMVKSFAAHNEFIQCRVYLEGDVTENMADDARRPRGLLVEGQYSFVYRCYFRGWNMGLVLYGRAPRYQTVRRDTMVECYQSGLNHLSTGGYGDPPYAEDYIGTLIDSCYMDGSVIEDNIQFEDYSPDAGHTAYQRGVVVKSNILRRPAENNIDMKTSSYIWVEDNWCEGAMGNDDGYKGGNDIGSGCAIDRQSGTLTGTDHIVLLYNRIWNGASGTTTTGGFIAANNVFANNRNSYLGANYAGVLYRSWGQWMDGAPNYLFNNINMMATTSGSAVCKAHSSSDFHQNYNIFYDSLGAVNYMIWNGTDYDTWSGLRDWQENNMNDLDGQSMETNPQFVHTPIYPYGWSSNFDFAIKSTSPARNAGRAHSYAVGAGSNSTSLSVENGLIFRGNFGNPYLSGHHISIGGGSAVEVDYVEYEDYGSSIVHLKESRSWADGAAIVITDYVSDGQPDIGAFEYGFSVMDTTVVIPPSTSNVSPADESSQSQPITFRWRASAGATRYWFCLSPDSWQTLSINNFNVTDTFLVVSGLPENTACVWNVAAGNSAGWSGWSADWHVTTTNTTTTQTVLFDWNRQIVTDTLTADADVEITNLSRISNILVLHNPDGRVVTWDAAIDWLDLATPPQPAYGSVGVYFFVRENNKAYGFDLSNVSSGTSNGVSAAWVLAQLSQYLKKDTWNDASIRLTGDQEFQRIVITESTGSDSVVIYNDQGILSFYDYEAGWKTLSELASGTGGGTGDITAVVAGYGITGGATTGSATVELDTTKLVPADTLGFAAADSSVYVLTIHHGRLKLATRPSGSSGISASAVHDSLVARSDDYATPTHTHSGTYPTFAQIADSLNARADDYLPTIGGTLTGTLTARDIASSAGLTYSIGSLSSPFLYGYFGSTQATNADTIGGSTQTGSKYTYWENTLGYLRFGYQSNGTVTLYRYSYTGGVRTLLSLTTNGTTVNHSGHNTFDSLAVTYDHALTVGGYKAMTEQDSANARIYSGTLYQTKPLGTAGEGKVIKYSASAGAAYWGTDSLGTGGGASDGQDADSLMGKRLDSLGRDKGPGRRTVPAYVPDSLKYKHIELAGFDSTGLSIGDSTACVLSVQANKIVITRQKNRSGSAAFTTTGQRVAIYIAGAKSTDRYFLQTYIAGTTPPSAVDTRMGAIPKTDSLVVYRPASGTSGQTFFWWRVP